MTHIHWVTWGTVTPKDIDEVNKREVSECDRWVCDLDTTGETSIFSVILSAAVLERMLPTFDLSCEENVVCLKWKWPLVDYARWTPEVVKNRSVSRRVCKNRRCTNSLCNLPDVLVRIFIDTQNRLVDLHSDLILGSRRDGPQPTQCNLSIHWIDNTVF